MPDACSYHAWCNEASHDVIWWVPLALAGAFVLAVVLAMIIWYQAERRRR